MRRLLTWLIRGILLLLSADTILLFMDYYEKWEWLDNMIAAHPFLQHTFRGPFFPLICLVLCFVVVYGEKFLKLPELEAEYLRVESRVQIDTLPLELMYQSRENIVRNRPYVLDADFMLEIYLVNKSEHKVSIRQFRGEALVPRPSLIKFPRISPYFPKRKVKLIKAREFENYRLKTETIGKDGNVQTIYTSVPDIEARLEGIGLERGIGYQGWIGFTISQIMNTEYEYVHIQIHVLDALGNTHTIKVKDKSVQELREYDTKLIPPL